MRLKRTPLKVIVRFRQPLKIALVLQYTVIAHVGSPSAAGSEVYTIVESHLQQVHIRVLQNNVLSRAGSHSIQSS